VKPLFFRTSRAAYRQVTELFDFVWPTAAALWNLRWQVQGFVSVVPQAATPATLNERFVTGSAIHGANLRRSCIDTSWPQQQQTFAKFLLIDLFALYEGWLAVTLPLAGFKGDHKGFEFPPGKKAGKATGICASLNAIHKLDSHMLVTSFYHHLTKHKKNSLGTLEAQMIAYRCFKECRNSLMHGGGIASDMCAAAYDRYKPLSKSDLAAAEHPEMHSIVAGARIGLSIRGVVGFSEVILKLIATLDAELARTRGAEAELLAQWQTVIGDKSNRPTLPTSKNRRKERIRMLVGKLGLPKPEQTGELETFLVERNLVSY
jgi:hypothetical protein